MKALKGVLVSCGDPAVKQILKWIDTQAPNQFIVRDLDSTHLVIQASAVDSALKALEEQLEKNTYSADALIATSKGRE
ncbi:nucleotide excision repair, TFIIH, subunit [Clavulina sp. PMI_390]|nr:nucleotide excision repair, TFIIH, subunit [Clavulina sp. PMI_390]